MNNKLVSLETAKQLKEKGFPQPSFECGQHWYIDDELVIIWQVSNAYVHIIIADGSGDSESYAFNPLTKEIIDNAFFAPDILDILQHSDFVVETANKLFLVSKGEIFKYTINPAETLAGYWLKEKQD